MDKNRMTYQPLSDEQLLHMRLRAPSLEPEEELETLQEEKKRLLAEVRFLRSQSQKS
jgi:hypothetical protein